MGFEFTDSRLDTDSPNPITLTNGVEGRACDPAGPKGDINRIRGKIRELEEDGVTLPVLNFQKESGGPIEVADNSNGPKLQDSIGGKPLPPRTALAQFMAEWENPRASEIGKYLQEAAERLNGRTQFVMQEGESLDRWLETSHITGSARERLVEVGNTISSEIIAALKGEKTWKPAPSVAQEERRGDTTIVLTISECPRYTTDLMTQGLAWHTLTQLGDAASLEQMAEMIQRDTWARMLEAYVTRQVIEYLDTLSDPTVGEKPSGSPSLATLTQLSPPKWISVSNPDGQGNVTVHFCGNEYSEC